MLHSLQVKWLCNITVDQWYESVAYLLLPVDENSEETAAGEQTDTYTDDGSQHDPCMEMTVWGTLNKSNNKVHIKQGDVGYVLGL